MMKLTHPSFKRGAFFHINGPPVYVHVDDFQGNKYVCIREFKLYAEKDEMGFTRKGLNLTVKQWNELTDSKLQALIRDASSQITGQVAPEVKGNQEHEEREPTAWPTEVMPGVYQFRWHLGALKYVIVEEDETTLKPYISFKQFVNDHSIQEEKGITITMETFAGIMARQLDINELIED